MKDYNKLSSKYGKKNRFANIGMKEYRKPILITLISTIIVCICSLLLVQVSKIEKADRNYTVIAIQRYLDDDVISFNEKYKDANIELIVFSPVQTNSNIDKILTIEGYGIRRQDFVPGTRTVIYDYTILFYNEVGHLIYKHTQKEEISFITEKIEELNWI